MKRSSYLSAEEDRELRAFARANGTSLNYALRLGLRLLVGLPIPSWACPKMDECERSETS